MSPAATSIAGVLTVTTAPVISVQPSPESICSGSATSFSVTANATGGRITYQWQSDVSGVIENLSNGGVYSNVTTATMGISNVTGLNNTNYLCIVTNATCSISSNQALLTVLNPPLIKNQPVQANVCSGSGTSFAVTATGSNLSYQWQLSANGSTYTNLNNTGVYTGVNADSLIISNVTGLNNMLYRCIINGACNPAATSGSVLLSVYNSISINSQPENSIQCAGNSVQFSVIATGGQFTYQWQSNVSGAFENMNFSPVDSDVTSPTLKISDVTGLNNTSYLCIISNGSCNIASNPALLTVLNPPVISSQPVSVNVCSGSTARFFSYSFR